MASRKSPSQRDPLSRLSQAVRAGSPASMGGRVANATPVTASTAPTRRNVAPATGGGPLGSADVQFTWSGTNTSNGVALDSATVTILDTVGDPDIAVDSGYLIMSASGRGLYVIQAVMRIRATTNALSTDVHKVELFVPGIGTQHMCFIGTSTANLSCAGWIERDEPSWDQPHYSMQCTGGTNRVYDGPPSSPASPISLVMNLARFPAV